MSPIQSGPLTRSAYFSDLNCRADAVARATAEKHRIDACPNCEGPRVYSKLQPIARCFRCNASFELSHTTTLKPSFRRCALCRLQNMAGRAITQKYCVKCASMTGHERAKRKRWAAEKEATIEAP